MPPRVRVLFSEDTASSSDSDSSGEDAEPRPIQSCSLLAAGRAFSGFQKIPSPQISWRVNVIIQRCDLEHGYLCGTMEALDVPTTSSRVVTFWEGEIVDYKNYTFFTRKWDARYADDIRHWSKFGYYSSLSRAVRRNNVLDLSDKPYIFMRWKEQHFESVETEYETEYTLTIAGFYYICFSRIDGSIAGLYYDPNGSLGSKIQLKPTIIDGRSGLSFSSYELQ